MPIRSGTYTCVNHPHQQLVRNAGISAITSVAKDNGKFVFNPSSGVPVVFLYCPDCGYVEIYAEALFKG